MATILKFAIINLAKENRKGHALLINFHIWLLTIGPKLEFWRIFENFGFDVLILKLPTFCILGDFQNLTFAGSLAAVATFVLA